MKKKYVIDYTKTNLKDIDFKDFLLDDNVLIANRIDMKNFPNLKKWLCYQLFLPNTDADIVIKKSNLIKDLGWNKYFQDNKIYLDCIFSMKTYLNMLLRLFNRSATNYSYFLIFFDDILNDNKMRLFCENNNLDFQEFKNCFDKLEEFAKLTNTVGNYMPVPDGQYNQFKGLRSNQYNDRIDLLWNDLFPECKKENGKKYVDWFKNNKQELKLDNLFDNRNIPALTKFGFQNKFKFEIEDIKNFINYLNFVNEWIINRNNDLQNKMKND